MTKVFIDDSIKITNLKRYDIKTKAIVNIIKDYKLYEQYIWIKKEIFKNYEKKFINENEDELKEIDSLYKYLIEDTENIDEDDLKENTIENNIEINTGVTNMDISNEEGKNDSKKIENSKINKDNSIELEDDNIDIESGSDIETKYNNYDVFNEIGKNLKILI